MRSRICELSTFGLLLNRILKLHPKLNLSTIKSIIRREVSRIDNASKSRSSRLRILTEEQRDHVYDIVNYRNPHIKIRDLLREVNDVIKK
jgi:predicted oxidoreductase (fatty acid repression mutant protein)